MPAFPGVTVKTTSIGSSSNNDDVRFIHLDTAKEMVDHELAGNGVYVFDEDRVKELTEFSSDKAQDYVNIQAYKLHEEWKDRELHDDFKAYAYSCSFGTIDTIHRSDGTVVSVDPDEWPIDVTMSEYLDRQ